MKSRAEGFGINLVIGDILADDLLEVIGQNISDHKVDPESFGAGLHNSNSLGVAEVPILREVSTTSRLWVTPSTARVVLSV
jgi:hypothetical protein